MARAHIRRDPFARASLMRQTVGLRERGPCAECGRVARFRYWWEPDAISLEPSYGHLFCSIGCWRIYHA